MLHNGLYLLFLIAVVFGGGFLVGKQTGIFEPDQAVVEAPVLLYLDQIKVPINWSAYTDLDRGAVKLTVNLGARDVGDAENLAGKMFIICQAVAGSALFAEKITLTREIVAEISYPGSATGEFTTTMPLQNGVCQ